MFVNESLKKRLNEGIIRKNFSPEKKLRCYWLNAKMLCTTFVRTRNLYKCLYSFFTSKKIKSFAQKCS